MNDIDKQALRRWLVVQMVLTFRERDNTEYPDDEFDRGVTNGREATLFSVARHLFGIDVIQMVTEAEKEATY